MSLSFNFLLIKRAEEYPPHRVVVEITGADSVKGPAAYRAQSKRPTTISLLSVSLSLSLSAVILIPLDGLTDLKWSEFLRHCQPHASTLLWPRSVLYYRERSAINIPHTGEHRRQQRGFPISSFHRTGSHYNSHRWEGRHVSLGHWVTPGCQRCSEEAP